MQVAVTLNIWSLLSDVIRMYILSPFSHVLGSIHVYCNYSSCNSFCNSVFTIIATNPTCDCALLGYYAALSGSYVPTFRDKPSVPSSTVKKSTSWPFKMGPIRCAETSVKDYHSTLRNIPEERRSHLHSGGSLKWRTTPYVFKVGWFIGMGQYYHLNL
jgi:hypothetical protein